MTTYTVTIQMNANTVDQLSSYAYQLYGFLAVASPTAGGAPLVWMSSGYPTTVMQVSFADEYSAYTSTTTQIMPGMMIAATFQTSIDCGQTLTVNSNGTGSVASGGNANAITIQNQSTKQFTSGIGRPNGSSPQPCCAFPLYANMIDVIAPVNKILLWFSNNHTATGTVVETAAAPGILIDMTSASERSVSYDINTGWNWGGASWASLVPANSNIVPILIQTSFAL